VVPPVRHETQRIGALFVEIALPRSRLIDLRSMLIGGFLLGLALGGNRRDEKKNPGKEPEKTP
jgi:hypothetical protein